MAMKKRWLCVGLVALVCQGARGAAAAPVAKPAPSAPTPLEPMRKKAAAANREALGRMARAIACPQKPPSVFGKYCKVAERFASGKAAVVPEGKTLLLAGIAAFILPGSPKPTTLGASILVVLALRNEGGRVTGKQTVLQAANPTEQAELATALGRTANAIEGKWDHVDMPAVFAEQIAALEATPFDPLEAAGDSYWPVGRDGMELRRAGNQWMLVTGIPDERRLVAVFADRVKLLAPDEKSPQVVKVAPSK